MAKSGRMILIFISFAVYFLSGTVIFDPLFSAENIYLAFIFAALSAFLIFEIFLYFFAEKGAPEAKGGGKLLKIPAGIFLYILSFTSVLLLMTEVIKDVAKVSGKGVNLLFYTLLALAMLSVSFYLCYNSEKGIYRFLSLFFGTFMFCSIIVLTAFLTSKGVIFSAKDVINADFSSIRTGLVGGTFFAVDSSAFLYIFFPFLTDTFGALCKRTLRFSLIFSLTASFVPVLCANLIFGPALLSKLEDPVLCLFKLIPGFDMTEGVSVIKIVSFMIKSSVYIYCSSLALSGIFGENKRFLKLISLSQYILIPIVFLGLSVFKNDLKFGAFQYMIYPSVIIFGSFCFLFYLLQKNN